MFPIFNVNDSMNLVVNVGLATFAATVGYACSRRLSVSESTRTIMRDESERSIHEEKNETSATSVPPAIHRESSQEFLAQSPSLKRKRTQDDEDEDSYSNLDLIYPPKKRSRTPSSEDDKEEVLAEILPTASSADHVNPEDRSQTPESAPEDSPSPATPPPITPAQSPLIVDQCPSTPPPNLLKMFTRLALTAFLASTSFLVRADVTPSDPGPGVVYQVGGTCHIAWDKDSTSATAWQNMAIELMTGDNYNMIHLTTVATGLDGTVDGTFDHVCPDVTPNAAIYFYQFSAPAASDKQWTTRFTIASSTGATTAPTNATQPSTGAAIPWGTGALVNPATAVAPPSFVASSSGAAAASNATSSANVVAATTTPATSTSTSSGLSSSSSALATQPPTNPNQVNTTNTTTSSNSTGSTQNNAAGAVVVDTRVWKAVMGLAASTTAFALFL
ncbi:hypothetical protein H0H93_003181 [Arthromyces matolae]|nr:hypothetical protein H0H93_003181 [Arthromyces matolae]